MFILLEFLVISIRVMLLFFGALFTFLLGENVYRAINNTLFAYSIPCMEMLSFIIAIVGPVAYFTGIYHQKSFISRNGSFNKLIFVFAFLFGVVITFLPITGAEVANPVCTQQITLSARVLQSLFTGFLAVFIAYISFDVGVFQAHFLTPKLQREKSVKKKKKR